MIITGSEIVERTQRQVGISNEDFGSSQFSTGIATGKTQADSQ